MVSAVKKVVDVPLIAKLTPAAPNIGVIAKACEEGGADAICAINTAGPGMVIDIESRMPVLAFKKGGLSGPMIKPIAVRCVYDIYQTVSIPIIGLGGITTGADAVEMIMAGASLVGIGSAVKFRGITVFQPGQQGTGQLAERPQHHHRPDPGRRPQGGEMITDLRPVMVSVAEKQVHSESFATLYFDFSIEFKPGQFIMVWIPGVDEKPYTISQHSPDRFAVTVEAKGLFSKQAVALEIGDKVGIRGPFGNGFNIIAKPNIAVVAGGCGMAPLAPLVDALESSGKKDLILIHGARSKEFLLYPDRFSTHRRICTDDGSKGHKGFVTDILEQEIMAREILAGDKADPSCLDMVYACGPEIMMARIFQICEAHNIPCQVSLERYMRCGFGVCGACVCGDRVVCKDGPVFGSQSLRTMEDFNASALLKSGKPVPLTNMHPGDASKHKQEKMIMMTYKEEFIEFLVQCNALKFGEFELKSGRIAPYFINTGMFDTGTKIKKLGTYYAQAIQEHFKDDFDGIYGPAYKGIPLVHHRSRRPGRRRDRQGLCIQPERGQDLC